METNRNTKTLIMKFGGASVASPESFSRITDIILHRRNRYPRVVVVVSAMGNTTDQLISLAKQVNPDPPRREYDMLVTVGERISISLLAMALAAKNQTGISFTGSQSGIITNEMHCDAKIVDVKPHRLEGPLSQGNIAIVAGFQGVSRGGEITTLGRGGSDTTAVALAVALKAEKVEFYKDVQGIYDEDPKIHQGARRREQLSYDQALEIVSSGAKVLHARCIELAKKNNILLDIRSFENWDTVGSLVGEQNTRISTPIYE